MTSQTPAILSFNRGRISPLALARTDFTRTALSAEVQTNWLPRALGAMSIRPGLQYTGATRSNLRSLTIPFVFSRSDTARLEITEGAMRVWVDDALITRPAVTAAITNGAFDTDLTGWSDQDSGTAASTWQTGGYLLLTGTGTAEARRRQQVTVAQTGVVHALSIVIERGPVLIRVGSGAGLDDYIAETQLSTGNHSLAFTPSGNFWIDLFSFEEYGSLVGGIAVAGSGTMEVPAPWTEEDLLSLRWDQSGDVIFVACAGQRQRRIERRNNDSWSIVEYQSNDGPFMIQNVGPVTIAPSAATGLVTLTANKPLFRSGHVGALYRLEQVGQSVAVSLTGDNQFSDPIRVAGVDGQRVFAIIIVDGPFTANITLQYSVDEPGSWIDATSGTYTDVTSISYDDTLDNQVIYYRIGIKPGDYSSGAPEAILSYSSGRQTGIARVVGYTSSTAVTAVVLQQFGSTDATSDWSESYWSGYRGYPSAVSFYEGRLWWAGKDRIWGSVTDDFASFDDTIEGDIAPISRSIGSGPVDTIHWLSPLGRLVMGADAELRSVRSSSLDEPLTALNFNLKSISTNGSESVAAVKVGTAAVFVSGTRFFEAAYDAASYDYTETEMSQVVPEIGEPGIVKMVAQQRPEKRIHAIRTDGTVALLVTMKQENVLCWCDYETDGFIEDAVVIPGSPDDHVYYTVRRTIDGNTVRYHEKFALESECLGFPEARIADAFAVYSGSATTTISGLDHLEGKEVVCWGWNTDEPFTNADGDEIGRDMGTFTVSSGEISGLPDAVTDAVVGLGYSAPYKSTKLAYATEEGGGGGLCMKKRVAQLGIIAKWLHARGLQYGPSFDYLDDLPAVEAARDVDENDMRSAYDEEMFGFPGEWDTDSRICLQANAPRPATVLAVVFQMETASK
jgi:hypothetical protein